MNNYVMPRSEATMGMTAYHFRLVIARHCRCRGNPNKR